MADEITRLSDKEIVNRTIKCYYDSLNELARVTNAQVVDMQAKKIIHNVVYVIGTILGKTEAEMYSDLIAAGVRKQPKRSNNDR